MRSSLKSTAILSLITVSLLSLQGCVVAIGNDGFEDDESWKVRQERNLDYINHLSLNLMTSDVTTELGDPDFKESYAHNNENFDILYYRTTRIDGDGQTGKEETTPLIFIDGKLIGWGPLALKKVTQ